MALGRSTDNYPAIDFSNYKQIGNMTKLEFLLLSFALMSLINCKTSNMKQSPIPKTGMFKVAILYPNAENKTFDMDYYEKKHMPMMAGLLGKNLNLYEIDKGIAGRTPNDKVPFVAVGYFYINDNTEYNKVIGKNITAISKHMENSTNIP